MSSTPAPIAEQAPGLSQVERVVNTFFEPSKTMADIRRSATWWLPFLLACIFSYGLIFTWQQKIGFEKLMDNQIQSNPKTVERMEKLSPEQRAQQMKISVAFMKGICYGYPVTLLLSLVVFSGVLLGIFNFGFGSKTSFGTAMCITAYSFLPGMISSILAVVTVFLSDPDGYDMRRPVASNLGALVSMTDHPALATLLSTFDVFTFWIIFLLATGFSVNSNGKVKRGAAFAAIFGVFFVVKLVMTGFAAM